MSVSTLYHTNDFDENLCALKTKLYTVCIDVTTCDETNYNSASYRLDSTPTELLYCTYIHALGIMRDHYQALYIYRSMNLFRQLIHHWAG